MAGQLSFTFDSPYLPRNPGEGNDAGRLWQGCHSSRVPLLVRLAYTVVLPLKSVGGRSRRSNCLRGRRKSDRCSDLWMNIARSAS